MLKKFCIFILLGLLTAFVVNRLYEVYLNHGNLYFAKCLEKSQQWADNLRRDDGPCFVFAGGSEVRMSIEPEIMLKDYGVRAINTGSTAGNGVRCNAQIALDFIKPGDTLVLSCISGNTNLGNDGMSHGGISFCVTQNKWETLINGILPLNRQTILSVLRGSSEALCIHVIRACTRPYIFFYEYPPHADISPSGRVNVHVLKIQERAKTSPLKRVTSFEKKDIVINGWPEIIEDLQASLKDKNVRIVVNISRDYYNNEYIRYINAQFALYLTKNGISVVKDPYLGACSDPLEYSDTEQHKSIEGGRRYSSWLAKQLKEEQFWTENELESILRSF